MNGLEAAERIRDARRDSRAADHRHQRLRRQGRGSALCRARRQRVPAASRSRPPRCSTRSSSPRASACMPRGVASTRRSSVSSKACTALLAEDNEANQMVATELLGRLGHRARHRRQRPRSDRDGRGRPDEVRGHPDGHADARARRPRGDARAPCRPTLRDGADHRHDRERDEGRPRRVSRRGDERSHHQADRPQDARRDAAALAARTTGRAPRTRSAPQRGAGSAIGPAAPPPDGAGPCSRGST